jgi:uncharacterized membrane protein (DUF4010 family)
VANARRAAAGEGSPQLLAAGVSIATAVSFLRVFAIAAVLQPKLLIAMGLPLIAAAAVAVAFAIVSVLLRSTGERQQQEVDFRNPFEFWSVVSFAVFLSAIIVLSRAVGESFGAQGAIIGAVVVGLADVDSLTISMARLMPDTLTLDSAACAILAAVASNTLSKIAIGAAIDRGRFAASIAVMALLCLAVAGAVLALTLALAAR